MLSVWREVRRDERQEPADWRSTREGFVAIKGRAKRFAGTSVGQVDCLVRADIDIGRIRRLPVGVFTAQIHATIVALRYFSRHSLAAFSAVDLNPLTVSVSH